MRGSKADYRKRLTFRMIFYNRKISVFLFCLYIGQNAILSTLSVFRERVSVSRNATRSIFTRVRMQRRHVVPWRSSAIARFVRFRVACVADARICTDVCSKRIFINVYMYIYISLGYNRATCATHSVRGMCASANVQYICTMGSAQIVRAPAPWIIQ